MDELEGLVKPRDGDEEDARAIEGGSATSSNKRAIEDGSASVNGNGAPDGQQAAKKSKTEEIPQAKPTVAKGLLSGSALDSLKKAAALRKAKQQKAAAASAAASSTK
jgi:hypothetical protein